LNQNGRKVSRKKLENPSKHRKIIDKKWILILMDSSYTVLDIFYQMID